MSNIKELSEVVEFVCSLANVVGTAAEDGKITIGDATHLIPLLYKLPSAVDGIAEISFADLSLSDLELINKKIRDNLDLPSEKVELAVEEALEIALKLYTLVQKLRS